MDKLDLYKYNEVYIYLHCILCIYISNHHILEEIRNHKIPRKKKKKRKNLIKNLPKMQRDSIILFNSIEYTARTRVSETNNYNNRNYKFNFIKAAIKEKLKGFGVHVGEYSILNLVKVKSIFKAIF
jgi:hypothetical protein